MYDDNISALNAYSDAMAITGHNIANLNTPDFKSRSFSYTGDFSGTVRANQYADNVLLNRRDQTSLSGEMREPAQSAMTGLMNNTVDVGQQTVNMMIAQRGFEANAAAIVARSENDVTTLGLIADYRA